MNDRRLLLAFAVLAVSLLAAPLLRRLGTRRALAFGGGATGRRPSPPPPFPLMKKG